MAQVSGPPASREPSGWAPRQQGAKRTCGQGTALHCCTTLAETSFFFLTCVHAHWLYPDLGIQRGPAEEHMFLTLVSSTLQAACLFILTLWGPLARPWISWCSLTEERGLEGVKAMCCSWTNLQKLSILKQTNKKTSLGSSFWQKVHQLGERHGLEGSDIWCWEYWTEES